MASMISTKLIVESKCFWGFSRNCHEKSLAEYTKWEKIRFRSFFQACPLFPYRLKAWLGLLLVELYYVLFLPNLSLKLLPIPISNSKKVNKIWNKCKKCYLLSKSNLSLWKKWWRSEIPHFRMDMSISIRLINFVYSAMRKLAWLELICAPLLTTLTALQYSWTL